MSTEVREINPPRLADENFETKRQVLCHRPVRRGSPKMSVEINNAQQVIVNHYGHGGSGWTLAPGCAAYVHSLFESSEHSVGVSRDSPISVIGAGVIGLFTGYTLVSKGYNNVTILAKEFENLTSHKAGGLLAPVSMDNDEAMQRVIDKIGVEAYKFYYEIANKKHKDFSQGAVVVPAYFESREASGLEPYVDQGVMRPAKDVVLNFKNGTSRPMVAYDDGIFIDTSVMMVQLRNFLEHHKVIFKQQNVSSFTDLESKYIFNCTGLGAKELCLDNEMISVQGHLLMLKDQVPDDLQYMLLVYYGSHLNAQDQEVKRSTYMFPKKLPGATSDGDIGVVGGTFIEGADTSTPNDEEFASVIENARRFYGLL